MKMKKLTALALAGVLCLGMSATAFAADGSPSPTGQEDGEGTVDYAKKTTQTYNYETGELEEKTEKVEVEIKGVDVDYPEQAKQINSWMDEEEGSDNIKEAIKGAIGNLYAQDKAAAQELESKLDLTDGAVYEVLDAYDYHVELAANESIDIRFNVNALKDSKGKALKEGQTIYLMHYVDGKWVVLPCTVEKDPDTEELYVKHNFDSLSPIAFVINANGETGPATPPTGPSDPTDPSQPSNPANPSQPSVDGNGSGTITADQLADLIVQRLQRNAAASTTRPVARTSSRVASPRTGE